MKVVKFKNPNGVTRYIREGSTATYSDHECTLQLDWLLSCPWDGVAQKIRTIQGLECCAAAPEPSTNPKQAFGDKKIPLGLVPRSFINGASLGLAEGMMKYGAWNFRSTKVEAMTYVSAVLRHFEAYIHGENCDPVTKVPHLYSAAAGLAILIDTGVQGTLIDNRPPKQDTSAQVKEIEEVLAHLKELYKDHKPLHYTCQTP